MQYVYCIYCWDEAYEYNNANQLLRQYTTNPSNASNKEVERLYTYDVGRQGDASPVPPIRRQGDGSPVPPIGDTHIH